MVDVDAGSFLVIVTLAALAAGLAAVVQSRLAIPVVVIEIVGGILVGPELLDLATPDMFVDFFANLGLGMLFFFAGYETTSIASRAVRCGSRSSAGDCRSLWRTRSEACSQQPGS